MNKLVILSSLMFSLCASGAIKDGGEKSGAGARCEGSLTEAGIPLKTLQELLTEKANIVTVLADLEASLHENLEPESYKVNRIFNELVNVAAQLQHAVNLAPEARTVTTDLFADVRSKILDLNAELKVYLEPEVLSDHEYQQSPRALSQRANTAEWDRLMSLSRLPKILK